MKNNYSQDVRNNMLFQGCFKMLVSAIWWNAGFRSKSHETTLIAKIISTEFSSNQIMNDAKKRALHIELFNKSSKNEYDNDQADSKAMLGQWYRHKDPTQGNSLMELALSCSTQSCKQVHTWLNPAFSWSPSWSTIRLGPQWLTRYLVTVLVTDQEALWIIKKTYHIVRLNFR